MTAVNNGRRAFFSGELLTSAGRERFAERSRPRPPVKLNRDECLGWKGVTCFACRHVCRHGAMRFDSASRPEFDIHSCTACGDCRVICPTNSIEVYAANGAAQSPA